MHSIGDSDLAATFGYVAREAGRRRIAFLMARESLGEGRLGPRLKSAFGGRYIANEKFTQATAEQVLRDGEADAVAFGVLFIANPDLPAAVCGGRRAQRSRSQHLLHAGPGRLYRLSVPGSLGEVRLSDLPTDPTNPREHRSWNSGSSAVRDSRSPS